MAILGNIVKRILDFTEALVPQQDHVSNQEKVLENLLEKAKDTVFGRYYKFDKLLESEDIRQAFVEAVPYHDYDKINARWWSKMHDGTPDITWPGSPGYFALSSGTTGSESKRIPVTDDMIAAIRRGGIIQITSLRNFDLPPEFFEKEFMMLGSSTDLEEKEHHKEGEISGISASRIPFWFRSYYKPGEEIAQIDDWDSRVHEIAKNAKNWDISGLSGIPSWMELMMKEVIKYHEADNIHDVWPNLQVYTSGGVAFEPYAKSFAELCGKPVTIIDTYLASEGFIACQTRPETDSMQLLTNNGIYFEFIPMNPDYIKEDGSIVDDAPSLSLKEVELNQDYILILSSVSGAWRYLIGDTIAFTDIERTEIKITGRTKFFLNTVGSQLSVNKLNDAVKELETKFDAKIPEYTICAQKIDGEFYHVWYLGAEDLNQSPETLSEALDSYLKSANKNYSVARSKALKGVKVHVIDPEVFYDWSGAQKKKGGQVKMEKVMNQEKFEEWEAFVQSQS
ncbi:GH3 family domain-containing protein [Portibacter marinus]|uniref:GH3 family domain-containing protein n=1 Tax=Portibacter marinus TaxID=2898660 RepID=UPI001F2651F2|nr:GH3 auxin-responsive promoter family protein [Portibacter marinus]